MKRDSTVLKNVQLCNSTNDVTTGSGDCWRPPCCLRLLFLSVSDPQSVWFCLSESATQALLHPGKYSSTSYAQVLKTFKLTIIIVYMCMYDVCVHDCTHMP